MRLSRRRRSLSRPRQRARSVRPQAPRRATQSCWDESGPLTSKHRTSELEQQIIRKWLERPEGFRSGPDVLAFYGELMLQQSPLLGFPYPGDKYQGLLWILRDHIEPDP